MNQLCVRIALSDGPEFNHIHIHSFDLHNVQVACDLALKSFLHPEILSLTDVPSGRFADLLVAEGNTTRPPKGNRPPPIRGILPICDMKSAKFIHLNS